MCGIAAILSAHAAIPAGAIQRMARVLRHRGPDAEGFAELPGCHLGHQRLSIIDLAGRAQPMADEAQRYWITFNGRAYEALRAVKVAAAAPRLLLRKGCEILRSFRTPPHRVELPLRRGPWVGSNSAIKV